MEKVEFNKAEKVTSRENPKERADMGKMIQDRTREMWDKFRERRGDKE